MQITVPDVQPVRKALEMAGVEYREVRTEEGPGLVVEFTPEVERALEPIVFTGSGKPEVLCACLVKLPCPFCGRELEILYSANRAIPGKCECGAEITADFGDEALQEVLLYGYGEEEEYRKDWEEEEMEYRGKKIPVLRLRTKKREYAAVDDADLEPKVLDWLCKESTVPGDVDEGEDEEEGVFPEVPVFLIFVKARGDAAQGAEG